MRLIDADKLLDILDVMIVGHKTASDVFDVVEDMPTVDAVPVVRCKYCKWHEDDFCTNFNVFGFEGDDYCSLGERRD